MQALILVGSATCWACARRSRAWSSASLLTLLVGGACAAASNALALTTKSEDVMAPVINMVMMPVLLLSGILLPMTLGPEWLQRVSDFMPFRWIVDAVRDSFAGDFATSAMFWGTTWALGLFGLAAVVGHRGLPQGERLSAWHSRARGSSRRIRSPGPRGIGSAGTGRSRGSRADERPRSSRARRRCGVLLLAAACGSVQPEDPTTPPTTSSEVARATAPTRTASGQPTRSTTSPSTPPGS